MMRAFVAVEISNSDVIDSITKFQSKININAKSVEPKNFHFTLQFLGEISDDLLQGVVRALRSIKFSSFSVSLKGVGAFPKLEGARVIWIGTDKDGGNMLIGLSKQVQTALRPLGLLPDKAFKPHITIFRIKKKTGNDLTKELENGKMAEFGTQVVTSIKLKKSELGLNGPVYSDMEDIKSVK